MPELTSAALNAFDESYVEMLSSMKKFFRFAQDHPQWEAELNHAFNNAYYSRVADTVKNSVDHEIKYLHQMTSK